MRNDLSLLCLRLGLGLVFLLFGFDKLPNPQNWIVFLPAYFKFIPLSAYQFLRLQGVIECLIGLHFFAGLFIRPIAFISACILAFIVYNLGFDQTGIRDTGLFFAALSLGFLGPGNWSLDAKLKWL